MSQVKRSLFYNTVFFFLVISITLSFVHSPIVKADTVEDHAWNRLDDLYYYSLDNQGINYINAAMYTWQQLSDQELNDILAPLYTEQTLANLAQYRLTEHDVVCAVRDLGYLIYTDQEDRDKDLLAYKIKHYKTFHALFGNEVNANYMFNMLITLYDGFPDALMEYASESLGHMINFANLIGAPNTKWVEILPEFIFVSLKNARTDHPLIHQAFTDLSWTNEQLIESEKRFAQAIDPLQNAQMTSILAVLRKNITLDGSDGKKLVSSNTGTDQIRGTISVKLTQPAQALDIQMQLLGYNVAALESLLPGKTFALWHSSNPEVVSVKNGILTPSSQGKALITWYRSSTNPAESTPEASWLYKFYVEVE